MTLTFRLVLALTAAFWIAGCGGSDDSSDMHGDDHDHPHGEHDGHDHGDGQDHGVTEEHGPMMDLANFAIGDMDVHAQQAGGPVRAGQEYVLFVTLPESNAAQPVVRAWIGTDDRTLSGGVATADYEEGHYHVHVMAPTPLPQDAMWWVEVEQADGTKLVGSTALQAE